MNIIGEEVGKDMSAMAWTVIEALGLYLILPMIVAAILLRVLRVRGEIHKFLVSAVGLAGLYFFFTQGIDSFGAVMQERMSK
ncbi:hypothetical protein B9G55_01570 [Saccharibacillus sp. O16]|nr:hypothetical protein B9G55_01570 [Saccharibacillus sp. O16]